MANDANLTLSPSEAQYVIEKALKDKKLKQSDIREYRKALDTEIADLDRRLSELRSMKRGGAAPAPAAAPASAPKPARGRRSRKRSARKAGGSNTAELANSRKIQGQYLGYLRQIPERNRKRFQAMAKNESRETAIAAMKKTLGK
ncbi:MAG: hypothetical protein WBX15_16660 [Thermoanaerobaculia bacterium]